MTIERKDCSLDIKAAPDDEGRFEGYASTFGNVDSGGDIIAPGAFKMSLAERKPKMLWQHDPNQPIGVWEEVREDDNGLFVKGRLLVDLPKGKEAASMLKAGVIDSMSIGYRTKSADRSEDGIRRITELQLWEVSLVTFPMNEKSLVTAIKMLDTKREVEDILRQAGVPNAFAKLVAQYGLDEAKARLNGQREADGQAETEGFDALLDQLRALKEKTDAARY